MKPGPMGGLAYRLAGATGYSYRQVELPTGEKKELPLVEYSDAAPTMALRELADDLVRRIDRELERLEACLTGDLPALNALCRAASVDVVVRRPTA